MTLPAFELARPRDAADAIAMRRARGNSRFVAGGTDLLVNLGHGLGRPDLLIDIAGMPELDGIGTSERGLRIGAGVTIAALARDPHVVACYGAVAQAAASIAGPGHRVLGTVGGNLCLDTRCVFFNQSEWWRRANAFCLKRHGTTCHVAPQGRRCHAAYSGDLAPALLALGATIEIAGPAGRRHAPLGDLYAEDGLAHLALADDELVIAVYLPADPLPSAYAKVRVRGAIDYPLAGVAVALRAADGVLAALRIALTGTNSRPFLLAGTDAAVGRPADAATLQEIERLVQRQVQPMRTTIAAAHYRRLAAAGLARRLVATLAGTACAGESNP